MEFLLEKALELGVVAGIAVYLIQFLSNRVITVLDNISKVLVEMSNTLVALQVRMDVVEDKLGIHKGGKSHE